MKTASPGLDVPQQRVARLVERDALGGEHVLAPARTLARADHERTDAVRIAESQHAVPQHHRDHRVAAAQAPVDRAHGGKDVGHRGSQVADPLQFAGEHVEQHLGVGGGVEVPAVLAYQRAGQFRGIGQVAVVGEADAVGRVDVERLGLGGALAAGGRVANVADADIALELKHVTLLEHVPHQAVVLAQEDLALVRRHDARGVLATMLQHRQGVVELLIGGTEADDADDAAHCLSLTLPRDFPTRTCALSPRSRGAPRPSPRRRAGASNRATTAPSRVRPPGRASPRSR